jgi:hypothetical protein
MTILVIEDLRFPVYMTSCGRSMNSETTLQLMSKVAWDIREVKSQHSQYVDVLLRVICFYEYFLRYSDTTHHAERLVNPKVRANFFWFLILDTPDHC